VGWSLVADTLAVLGRALPDAARPSRTEHPEPLPEVPVYAYFQLATFVGRRLGRVLFDSDEEFDAIAKVSPQRLDEEYPDGGNNPVCWVARTIANVGPREPKSAAHLPRELPKVLARAIEFVVAECGIAAAKVLLEDIDDEHRRLDAIHAVDARRLMPTSLIEIAVYRGAGNVRNPPIWLTLMQHRRFGLLWLRDRNWAFTEGDREEVLAHVPDLHFERAAAAAALRLR
jgi:hypothetical protein